jgi:putative ABC transport system permease protein
LVFKLLWQLSVPVLIANAIAWPVVWYCLHGRLPGFSYRTRFISWERVELL